MVVFGNSRGYLQAGRQLDQGMMTEGDGNGCRFAPIPVLLDHESGMTRALQKEGQGPLVLNHHPVGAHIDPSFLRIPGHHGVSRSDVSPAIAFKPLGRGELVEVNFVPFHDVLKERSAVHEFR